VSTVRTSLLAVYAAANLAVGVGLVFTQPSRADDVWIMYDWCRAWLLHGQQLYAGVDARTDYPPNAIVFFAPLALVPRQWVVPAWAALTLLLTPLYAYIVIKSTSPAVRGAAAVVPMLLFFCWGGVRTFLEFSRLSLTLAFVAVLMADSRPVASGVSLGLALAKPHIAGPIMLWALVTGRARVVAVATAVVAAGFAIYCLRAQVDPVTVLTGYGRILLSLYSGTDGFVGRTSLRPWWLALGGDQKLGDLLWGAGAGLLLLVPCVLAMRAAGTPGARAAGVRALFCLWSLLTIYHIGNNLAVLMLPAFVFLLLFDDPATARWRMCAVVTIQAVLMLDIPVHLASLVPEHGPAFILVRDVDRIVVLLTFIMVAVLLHRRVSPASLT
jgi:hypothetical protein